MTHLSRYMTVRSLVSLLVEGLRAVNAEDTAQWLLRNMDTPEIRQMLTPVAERLRERVEVTEVERGIRRKADEVVAAAAAKGIPVTYTIRPAYQQRAKPDVGRVYRPVLVLDTPSSLAVRVARQHFRGDSDVRYVLWGNAPDPDPGRTVTQLGDDIAATVEKDWKSGRGATRRIYAHDAENGLWFAVYGGTTRLGRPSPHGGWDGYVHVAEMPLDFMRLWWSQTVPVASDVVEARRAIEREHRAKLAETAPERKEQKAAVRDRRLDVSDLPEPPPRFRGDLSEARAGFLAGVRVDRTLAYHAHAGSSFTPERRAEQEQEGAVAELGRVWDSMLMRAGTLSEAQVEATIEGLRDYRSAYLAAQRDRLHRQTGIVSSMIAGPSNFPVARMQKRNEALRKAEIEAEEKLERILSRIARDVEAIGVQEAGGELAVARRRLAEAVRRGEDSATVRRLGERVETLRLRERAASAVDAGASDAAPDPLLTFGDVTVELDPGDNRIRVIFPKGAHEPLRASLKSRGFVFSFKAGAHQRKWTSSTAHDIDTALRAAGLVPSTGSDAERSPVYERFLALSRYNASGA